MHIHHPHPSPADHVEAGSVVLEAWTDMAQQGEGEGPGAGMRLVAVGPTAGPDVLEHFEGLAEVARAFVVDAVVAEVKVSQDLRLE